MFQASIAASVASLWWIASTGPSVRRPSCASVTTTAISMIRSRRGIEAGHLEVDPDQVVVVGGQRGVDGHAGLQARNSRSTPAARARTYTGAHVRSSPGPPLFAAALVASLAIRAWLLARQVRHVAAASRRGAGRVPLDRSSSPRIRRAADYTLAKARLAHWQMVAGAAILLGWTLFGGLDALNAAVRDTVAPRAGALAYEVALVVAFVVVGAVLELPFEWYSTFRLEQRFGFNRMTWRLWLADTAEGRRASARVDRHSVCSPPCSGSWALPARMWWLWAWARVDGDRRRRAGDRAELHRAALQPASRSWRTRRCRRASRR